MSGILPLALVTGLCASRTACPHSVAAFCKDHPHRVRYLALCHQLPKNSENQIYFPITAEAPLCAERSL